VATWGLGCIAVGMWPSVQGVRAISRAMRPAPMVRVFRSAAAAAAISTEK